MPQKLKDLTDQKFGNLTVIERDLSDTSGNSYWLCICDCGNTISVRSYNLRSGRTKSCGCTRTHGMTHSPEYKIWKWIKQRCYYNHKSNTSYKNYGGRGIKMDPKWKESFEAFYKDMGPKPFSDATIERIDTNGNYCKDNCKWIKVFEQAGNKRNNNWFKCVDIKGNKFYSKNANEFERMYPSFSASMIHDCLKGRQKTHRGCVFSYVTETKSLELEQARIKNISGGDIV